MCIYHGPNAELLGFVRSSRWQYKETTDLHDMIFNTMTLCVIDAISLLVTGVMLKVWCGVNVWHLWLLLERKLRRGKSSQILMSLSVCFNIVSTFHAVDMTLKFKWIKDAS